jgi:hypothetical protein
VFITGFMQYLVQMYNEKWAPYIVRLRETHLYHVRNHEWLSDKLCRLAIHCTRSSQMVNRNTAGYSETTPECKHYPTHIHALLLRLWNMFSLQKLAHDVVEFLPLLKVTSRGNVIVTNQPEVAFPVRRTVCAFELWLLIFTGTYLWIQSPNRHSGLVS